MLTSRPTHGGGAPLGIDLEAGIAKITVRRPAPEPETTSDAAPGAAEDEATSAAEPDQDPTPGS